jgi:mannosyltransferase
MSRRQLAALIAITLAALLIRLPGLGRSLWYDELYTYVHFLDSFTHAVAKQSQANNHPLASLLAWLSRSLFGESEVALRLPSLLAGSLAVFALGWVTARASTPAAGLTAALLAATNPAHVAYSQEVRGYALVLLFVPIVTGLALDDRARKHWLALATALALWSHLTMGVLVLGLALYAAVTRDRRALAGLTGGLLLGAILYSPMLGRLGAFVGRETGSSPPTLERLAKIAELFSVADARVSLYLPWIGVAAVFFGLVVAGLVVARREPLARATLAVLVVTMALWLVARPLFYPRFFLFFLPLLLACAARALARTHLIAIVMAMTFGLATWERSGHETQPLREVASLSTLCDAKGTGSALLVHYPHRGGAIVMGRNRTIVLVYAGDPVPAGVGYRLDGLYGDIYIVY